MSHFKLPQHQQHWQYQHRSFVKKATNETDPNILNSDAATFTMRGQENTESPTRAAQRLQQDDLSPTNMETRIADTMNRLASPDFPPELLLQVVETAVFSQVSHWKVTFSHKLNALAASLFTWPDGVTDATRRLLQQTAETALLKHCIIRIPASLYGRQPPRDITLPALLKREIHIRHLVMDLNVHAGRAFSWELRESAAHMAMLAETFPQLASCTFLLHIICNSTIMLALPGWKFEGTATPCKMEDNLLDFIAAFAGSGPGRRKLIRFSKQRTYDLSFREFKSLSAFRPLVRVKSPDVSSTVDSTEDALANEEQQSTINAKRILDKAFRGPWERR